MNRVLNCTALVIITGFMASSCKKSSVTGEPVNERSKPVIHNMARLTTPNNSQSIPLETANLMLNSYLTSVGYPAVDTAVRSMSFDADTLRAYLQNPNIVTVKFMLAHEANYAAMHENASVGLNANKLTMVVVGLDDNNRYILNAKNEVYDHFSNCPLICVDQIGDPFIH